MKAKPIVPPLKWVGGKRRLASAIADLIPSGFDTYAEPFTGMAAVLVELLNRGTCPDRVLLADLDPNVRRTWKMITRGEAASALESVVRELGALGTRVPSRRAWEHAKRLAHPGAWLYAQSFSFGGHCPPGGMPGGYDPSRSDLGPVIENFAAIERALEGREVVIADGARHLDLSSAIAYLDPPYAARTDSPAEYGALPIADVVALARGARKALISTTEVTDLPIVASWSLMHKAKRGEQKPVVTEFLYTL
jgi:D12 class N6 adenine-specific DNA methyltransferase